MTNLPTSHRLEQVEALFSDPHFMESQVLQEAVRTLAGKLMRDDVRGRIWLEEWEVERLGAMCACVEALA